MDNAVRGEYISGCYGGAFDAQSAIGEANHRIVSVHHAKFGFAGDVSAVDGPVVHVVEEDVAKRLFSFGGVECCEIDACCSKGLIGRCKDGEGPLAAKRFGQIGLHQRCEQRGVDTRASSRFRDVVRGVAGCKHGVNDVDDAVAGHHVRSGHGGVVDHDGVRHAERQGLTVDGRCRHAVADLGCRNRAGHDVIEQDVNQIRLPSGRVVLRKINARFGKGLVGWGEHRVGTFALKRFNQFGLDQSGNQRRVAARALSRAGKIVGRVGRGENGVDDVDDAVAGHDVGGGDGGAVDPHVGPNGERQCVAAHGLSVHAVRNIGRGDSS